jgi:hypothetical protein
MMSLPLKPGDRVRVTVRNRMAGYLPGDKGTVLRVSEASISGAHYFTVAMDKDDPTNSGVVFAEDEIEPDV